MRYNFQNRQQTHDWTLIGSGFNSENLISTQCGYMPEVTIRVTWVVPGSQAVHNNYVVRCTFCSYYIIL